MDFSWTGSATPSFWHNSVETPAITPLSADHETDFLIVGGGFTGLSAARFLSEACPNMKITVG